MSDNLNNSFAFARKLFSDFGRLVILIVLDLIPIVNLIVTGYASRVLKESPAADSPPKLENYGDLFMDGLKIAIASIIYMLIPLILIAAGFGSVFAAMVTGGSPNFTWGGFTSAYMGLLGGAGIVLVLIGLLVAFVMLILVAAGVAHMIKTGKFGKAFAFGEILGIIGKIGWGRYLAWLVLIVVIAAIVGAIAGALPFVGWIIAAIIGPALTVFYFRSLGLLYSQ
ncbi:MAG: DUF4013 domain-containing protein [Candidatus Bathyarchaeia archaeon]